MIHLCVACNGTSCEPLLLSRCSFSCSRGYPIRPFLCAPIYQALVIKARDLNRDGNTFHQRLHALLMMLDQLGGADTLMNGITIPAARTGLSRQNHLHILNPIKHRGHPLDLKRGVGETIQPIQEQHPMLSLTKLPGVAIKCRFDPGYGFLAFHKRTRNVVLTWGHETDQCLGKQRFAMARPADECQIMASTCSDFQRAVGVKVPGNGSQIWNWVCCCHHRLLSMPANAKTITICWCKGRKNRPCNIQGREKLEKEHG